MRIVIDTNQLVRALIRPPQLATFVMAWEARRFDVVCSEPLLDEYQRVLNYPEVADLVYPELLRAFRSHLIHDLDMVVLLDIQPICRDPDDDKVIATAITGKVEYLVTADGDLLTPEVISALGIANVAVISMDELIKQLG